MKHPSSLSLNLTLLKQPLPLLWQQLNAVSGEAGLGLEGTHVARNIAALNGTSLLTSVQN